MLALGPAVAAETIASSGGGLETRRVLYEGEGGAACSDYLAGVLAWQRRGGDWRDAKGKPFGEQPYSDSLVGPGSTIFDITELMRKWGTAGERRGTLFLRRTSGNGYASFASREARGVADWPLLVLEFSGGRREMLKPTGDTHLDCSTYRSQGRSDSLRIVGASSVLLEFPLPSAAALRGLTRAQLVLTTVQPTGGGPLRIGVFEAAIPSFPSAAAEPGLATNYPGDAGIERDGDVVFATSFDESGPWRSRWARESAGDGEPVKDDPANLFEALAGKALRIILKKGSNLGLDLRLNLRDHGGETSELFVRYYLRLGNDWDPTVEGGKLPGLAGTYGKAGWGGRRSDGSNGWSLRASFLRAFSPDHPMYGLTQLATYAYHADMASAYGDHWIWPGALLQRNRWYCIEQHVRLNRPGGADGLFRVWIDGSLVLDRPNLRLRTLDNIKIENFWLNVYHGGTAVSPYDQRLYVDNVVIARRYIGPMLPASKR